MNIVSKLKNIKHGIFALITNGIVDVLSNFKKHPITGLAAIAINASMLPSIYYFYKLIKARQEGSKDTSKDTNYNKYGNVTELVEAAPNPNIMDESGPITDPRKEEGVVVSKTTIYRLTCVIGSIISLAFSILSLYSFISSWRFKNQMNARDISFTLLSPLVAAVTIFLQGQLVGDRLPKLIKRIGISRPSSTIRDEHHYHKSEPMTGNKKPQEKRENDYSSNKAIAKPHYYSSQCAVSLSFVSFAQLIAVYKLPNTMRIPVFVACANLCFAFSKLIFDAYYAYQCNIYDRQNIVVVMGEKIRDPDNVQPRELRQIRLAGKVGELREALKTKLDETIELIKNQKEATVPETQLLAERVVILQYALGSLEYNYTRDINKVNKDIVVTINHINHSINDNKPAIYSTGFNGDSPSILKGEYANPTQPLEKKAYIHEFKYGEVKMENQHLYYQDSTLKLIIEAQQAANANGEANKAIKVYENKSGHKDKATIALLDLVATSLAANCRGLSANIIQKSMDDLRAEINSTSGSANFYIATNPDNLLTHIQSIHSAFKFEVNETTVE